MEQIDITKMSLVELEAMAYREVVQRDNATKNINLLEQQILKKRMDEAEKETKNGKSNTDQSASQ